MICEICEKNCPESQAKHGEKRTQDFARMWTRRIGFECRLVEIIGKFTQLLKKIVPEASYEGPHISDIIRIFEG